jgi:hypothetical protein
LLVAACESRYGAYFVIKGDVHFDQVELYFGKPIDSSGPGSGQTFATPMFGKQSGAVFKRTFDTTDVVTVPAGTQTTFYLPQDTNQHLGAYVVAVALHEGKPVGIAEYFDFAIPSDSVYEYILDVEPWNPQQMERWGEAPGCVAWKKPRDGTAPIVAVVHDDDRDCDAQVAAADCDDLCSAQSSACTPGEMFCSSNVGYCALGCTRSGTCAPALCLPPMTCSPLCVNAATFQERLECGALMEPTPHFEIFVDRDQELNLCASQFVFAPGVPCTMPKIEAADPRIPTDFAYMIKTDPDNPAKCKLEVAVSSTTMLGDFENHHLLISIAPEGAGPRPTFTVGVQALVPSTTCTGELYTVATPPKPLFDCTPP